MRKQWIVQSIVLLTLLLAPFTVQYAQNSSMGSGDSNHAKQLLAVKLLRAINTAEANYHNSHGEYAAWAILVDGSTLRRLEDSPEYGAPRTSLELIPGMTPEFANLQLSKGPEILPGWTLRLDLTADGKGYDVLLEDTTDKTCGYAALTDERGVIRQSKAIDCPI